LLFTRTAQQETAHKSFVGKQAQNLQITKCLIRYTKARAIATALTQPGIFALSKAATPIGVFSFDSRERVSSVFAVAQLGKMIGLTLLQHPLHWMKSLSYIPLFRVVK